MDRTTDILTVIRLVPMEPSHVQAMAAQLESIGGREVLLNSQDAPEPVREGHNFVAAELLSTQSDTFLRSRS